MLLLILGSAASRFEATSQPSSGPPKTEDVRLNPLTGTLANVIAAHQRSNRHVDEAKLWGYCVQLLVALHTIHRIHIVHRDVKPHNIFLGAGDVVKVGDFGVSKLLGGSRELATTVVGSPGYLAPELCSGEPYDAKAGVWS